MEEKKKRQGYKDIQKQIEADKRYLAKHPEAKEKKKISAMKSNAKRFIKDFATFEELIELKELIQNKIDGECELFSVNLPSMVF